jgi:electron-transferring-flavoprotein dehydrogenase
MYLCMYVLNVFLFVCFFQGKGPWTFRNTTPDHLKTKKASECKPIEYMKPDGVISFDLLTNLQRR